MANGWFFFVCVFFKRRSNGIPLGWIAQSPGVESWEMPPASVRGRQTKHVHNHRLSRLIEKDAEYDKNLLVLLFPYL